MKVIHVETGMHLYGGALQVFYLLRGLCAEGIQNILVCSRGSEIASVARPYADVREFTCRGELDAIFGHRLLQIVRDEKPGLLHLHSRRGADVWGSLVARRTGQRTVLTRRVDNPEPSWLARWKYRPFQKVVTISEGIREVLLREGVPADKVLCVHSALDVDAYQQPPERHWFLREFGLSEGTLAIGVVAQLIERKGHRFLIDAAPKILAACAQARFLFFGMGPQRAALEDLCRRSGVIDQVCFAGFRKDLPRILPNLDLVVHPALMEGLGIALLQASAAGVPIVATHAGGIPEAVRDGLNGILVEPGDADGLEREIVSLLRDPERRERLGEAGRAWVAEKFSIPAMVKGNLAVYASIL